MLVSFAGVVPEKLAFIESGLGVELEMQRFDLGHAFQRVQVGASAKRRRGIGEWPALTNQPGVTCAGKIACARKHPTRLLLPQPFDDFPAQGAER